MSAAARSIFIYGVYMGASGLWLAVFPSSFLALGGFAPTAEPWIRMYGLLVTVLGAYYGVAARHELRAFFVATVFGRVALLGAIIALAVAGGYGGRLVLFAVPDQLSALWMWLALRRPD